MTGVVRWKAPFNAERAGFDQSIARNEQATEKNTSTLKGVFHRTTSETINNSSPWKCLSVFANEFDYEVGVLGFEETETRIRQWYILQARSTLRFFLPRTATYAIESFTNIWIVWFWRFMILWCFWISYKLWYLGRLQCLWMMQSRAFALFLNSCIKWTCEIMILMNGTMFVKSWKMRCLWIYENCNVYEYFIFIHLKCLWDHNWYTYIFFFAHLRNCDLYRHQEFVYLTCWWNHKKWFS